MKKVFLNIIVLAALVAWIIDLQRRLNFAQMRGDMYRDISARLDRRIAELSEQQPPAAQP